MERYQSEHLRISQALRGVITNSFNAVWFEFSGNEVEIHIVLDNEDNREAIAIDLFRENYGALVESSSESFSVHVDKISESKSPNFSTTGLVFLRAQKN